MKGNFKRGKSRGNSGKSRIIAVDFDGTVVKHRYPYLGSELPNATDVLNKLVKAGHKLILLTMRDGSRLEQAVQWFRDRNVYIWAVNENPDQKAWTASPKVYVDLYIDDLALGCPMNKNGVDWYEVEVMLDNLGFF
jgi:hypothetical protein